MKDNSICEGFWASSHEMHLGREWESSFLAQRRDEPLLRLSKTLALLSATFALFLPAVEQYLEQSFHLDYLSICTFSYMCISVDQSPPQKLDLCETSYVEKLTKPFYCYTHLSV